MTGINDLHGTVSGTVVQAQAIHGGLHLHSQTPTARASPCQPPPDRPGFVDRTDALAAVAQAADGCQDTPATIVITGMGGIGKTALAVHALRGLRHRFPGGLLYTDLHAPSPCTVSVLGRWLRALGIHPTCVPAETDEAAALWRSLTTDRAVAVLADDAHRAAEITPLLPGTGLTLITSRHRIDDLAAHGARHLILAPLDPEAAVELATTTLGDRATSEPQAVRALATGCGGLPLAVCVTAAHLATRPHRTLRSAAPTPVSSPPPEENPVTTALDDSYHALDAPARRAYRLLAVAPGPHFTTATATAILDIEETDADQLIDTLISANLLEALGGGRYAFHTLVGEHARRMAECDESTENRHAAEARAIDYYLHAAAIADQTIMPGRERLSPAFTRLHRAGLPRFADVAEAMAWTETELPNLTAAQHAAAHLDLHTLAWQYCEVVWAYLLHRHDYPTWEQMCQTALDSAQACADPHAEARIRTLYSVMYRNLGHHDQAYQHAARALKISHACGNRAGQASAHEHLGAVNLAAGRPDDAVARLEEGRALYYRLDHPRGRALVEHVLGRAHTARGHTDQALTTLHAALRTVTDLGERYLQARVLTSIGEAHLAAGNLAGAIDPLHQALPAMETEDAPLGLAHIHTALAQAIEEADPGQARAHIDQAIDTYQTHGLTEDHPAHARARHVADRLHELS